MADNQEEKIKKILSRKGVKIQEVVEKLFPNAKGSYYIRVRKTPLDPEFIQDIKSHFGIDLVKELGTEEPEDMAALKKEVERLRKEVIRLQAKLLEILEKK